MARHAGCFKLGLKPTQLYVRLSIISHERYETASHQVLLTLSMLSYICMWTFFLIHCWTDIGFAFLLFIHNWWGIVYFYEGKTAFIIWCVGGIMVVITENWTHLYAHICVCVWHIFVIIIGNGLDKLLWNFGQGFTLMLWGKWARLGMLALVRYLIKEKKSPKFKISGGASNSTP